jgi:hypothetical protein
MVGMDVTPYFAAVAGFSSTLSLTMVNLSPCAAAISSRIGATILHGPHHSAQKSTRTGVLLVSTTVLKSSSVTCVAAMISPRCHPNPKLIGPLSCVPGTAQRPMLRCTRCPPQ